MKQLNEIPRRQKRRPQVKRYRVYDFSNRSERIHSILAYCGVYLGAFMITLYLLTALWLT